MDFSEYRYNGDTWRRLNNNALLLRINGTVTADVDARDAHQI